MIRSVFKKIRNNEGGAYIETAFVLMVLMWIVAMLTAILPVFTYINKINTYANHVARILSVEGGLTSDAEYRIEQYRDDMELTEISLDYSESEFFDGFKVQLNDEIVVEANSKYYFNFLGFPVTIPIDTKAVSRSEVYYK